MPISIPIDETKMRLSLDDAVTEIRKKVTPISDLETVALGDSIGRVASESLVSRVDLPPSDASAMDGIACRHADLPGPLTEDATVYAETASSARIEPGHCARIMTGGALPENADTVVIRENLRPSASGLNVVGDAAKGQHIRRRGESIRLGRKF